MKIYLSPFHLTPKVRLNRSSGTDTHQGLFLMAEDKLGYKFSEYFPHVGLGDQSLLEFKKTFPDPSNPYHQKILTQLSGPKLKLPLVQFKNHQLWRAGDLLHSTVMKCKLMHERDFAFLEPLRSFKRVRLDANGLFTGSTFQEFLSHVPEDLRESIDYIEDPTASTDWQDISIPRARDFILGNPFEYTVFKPNRSIAKLPTKHHIFSGNMGHALGTLLAYEELVRTGNLQEIHGLLTPDIFEEELNLFQGSYFDGFLPHPGRAQSFLTELEARDWSFLCTM